MLGNVQNKIIQAFQSHLNNFFSVYQSIATHIFVNFVRPHAFEERGFESTSLFRRDVGLSPHLVFGGRRFKSTTLFWGVVGLSSHLFGGVVVWVRIFVFWGWGSFFKNFCLGGGGGFTLIS